MGGTRNCFTRAVPPTPERPKRHHLPPSPDSDRHYRSFQLLHCGLCHRTARVARPDPRRLSQCLRAYGKTLGWQLPAWQIQSDNYQKKQLFPFMQTLTQHFTPAAVAMPSKADRTFLQSLQPKYFRLMPNTSGHGVKSGRAVQVSDDWIESHKKSFPDYAGCCSQIEQVIELDRTTKREAYLQRWNELEADRRRPFDRYNACWPLARPSRPETPGDGIAPPRWARAICL